MIIGATRIRSRSGHRALADHVWRGPGNAEVATLAGCEADLEDMVAAARAGGHPYAIRHVHISPGEPVTDAEAQEIVSALGAEFGFDCGAVVLVRHHKSRRARHDLMLGTRGHEQHWHLLVPEVDPITGKVLDSRWMRPRHERVARESELRLLHQPTKGRFNAAVLAALEASGDHASARRLREAGLAEGPPAFAAYTSDQRRRLERSHAGPRGEDLDLPGLVRRLAISWAAHAPNPPALAAALRHEGLRLRHPDAPAPMEVEGRPIAPAPPTTAAGWVVDGWDGRSRAAFVVGAAHRLLREPRARVAETLRSRTPVRGLAAASPRAADLADDAGVPTKSADPQSSADSISRGRPPFGFIG